MSTDLRIFGSTPGVFTLPPHCVQNSCFSWCEVCEKELGEYVFTARPFCGPDIVTCSEKCRRRAVREGHSTSL